MDDFDGGPMRSPMFMILGMMTPVLVVIGFLTLMAPVLLYVIARWKQHREPTPDPQLGVKFALCFFRQLGYQTMLAGAFLILYGLTTKMLSSDRDAILRPAFGMLVPGLLVWGGHNLALQRTNRIERPMVEQLFAGYNLLSTGTLGFVALVLVFQSLFSKGDSGEQGRIVWSMALVYTSAWITQGVMYLNRVLENPLMPSQTGPSAGTGGTAAGGAAGGASEAPWTKPLA